MLNNKNITTYVCGVIGAATTTIKGKLLVIPLLYFFIFQESLLTLAFDWTDYILRCIVGGFIPIAIKWIIDKKLKSKN